MTTKRKKTEAAAKPALHIRVAGIRIPIWKNEGKDGIYYMAGQPELSYKGQDGQWHSAKSYGPRDLFNLIKAAALVHSEIQKLNHATRPQGDEVPEAA